MEAAIAFLRDAGIIDNAPKQVGKRKKTAVAVAANEWTVVEAKEREISILSQGSFMKEPVTEGHYVTRRAAAKAVAASPKNTVGKRSSKK